MGDGPTVTVGEGGACVFVAVDHCTTECIGLHAATERESVRGPGADPRGRPGVREPEGNGVAERSIRTLKENVLWARSFETIEELHLTW